MGRDVRGELFYSVSVRPSLRGLSGWRRQPKNSLTTETKPDGVGGAVVSVLAVSLAHPRGKLVRWVVVVRQVFFVLFVSFVVISGALPREDPAADDAHRFLIR